jgi:hypothetical protein
MPSYSDCQKNYLGCVTVEGGKVISAGVKGITGVPGQVTGSLADAIGNIFGGGNGLLIGLGVGGAAMLALLLRK